MINVIEQIVIFINAFCNLVVSAKKKGLSEVTQYFLSSPFSRFATGYTFS